MGSVGSRDFNGIKRGLRGHVTLRGINGEGARLRGHVTLTDGLWGHMTDMRGVNGELRVVTWV